MSPSSLRRVLVGVVVLAAATVLPIRTAWSAPAVRLDELAADPGDVVGLTHPSSHLGVRWIGEETDVLQARWRAEAAGWSAWTQVEIAHDLGDDATDVRLSGLLVVDDAVDAQVRVLAGTPDHIEVVAIDTEHGPRHLVIEKPPAGAQTILTTPTTAAPASSTTTTTTTKPTTPPPVAQPNVITRAQWGADESMKGSDPPLFAPITRLALHHTAGAEGEDPAATVRAIYAYHTKSNGWNDIGYNFLVDSAGRIYEGRYARDYARGEIPTGETTDQLGVIGAHISGNNTGTVGIALLGDFSGDAQPTSAAVRAAEKMFAWKADRHDINVAGTTSWSTGEKPTLIGHRDAGTTACPGDRLYEQLPAMRSRIVEVVGPVKPKPTTTGYWVLGRDTALYTFGDAPFQGGAMEIPAPAVSMSPTRTGLGYWLLSANGRVSAYGDAGNYGSTEAMRLNAPAVRLEPTRSGKGYWIQAADGGIFSFGDATFYGSTGSLKLNSPVISMSATPSGRGYWLLAGDGGVFTFGDGEFFGSTGSMKLNAPVVSMAPHPNGRGYWLQARDGGIFSFGEVRFFGSVPGLGIPSASTVQIRTTPSGDGYYVMAADGGIFTFGDARFHGAQPGLRGGSVAIDLGLKFGSTA
ncbi:MAG TPA: N-acetylmuramoyl-L-alanine amidase [Acidimicrobiales bacterium]|nr:N-acetylmuramoyl-L-alanine amidase [Acidimicrobiales bacterium]